MKTKTIDNYCNPISNEPGTVTATMCSVCECVVCLIISWPLSFAWMHLDSMYIRYISLVYTKYLTRSFLLCTFIWWILLKCLYNVHFVHSSLTLLMSHNYLALYKLKHFWWCRWSLDTLHCYMNTQLPI